MNFSLTVDIAATPDRVWAVISDIEHWSDWTPTVRIEALGLKRRSESGEAP